MAQGAAGSAGSHAPPQVWHVMTSQAVSVTPALSTPPPPSCRCSPFCYLPYGALRLWWLLPLHFVIAGFVPLVMVRCSSHRNEPAGLGCDPVPSINKTKIKSQPLSQDLDRYKWFAAMLPTQCPVIAPCDAKLLSPVLRTLHHVGGTGRELRPRSCTKQARGRRGYTPRGPEPPWASWPTAASEATR